MTDPATTSRATRGRSACGFTARVIQGQWFTVFASCLIMAGAGGSYLFGIYSKQIKASLGYDQTTLNLLGFSKDLGGNVGVLSGLIAEVTPTWFVLLLGSATNFVGYFMIWLAVTGKIPEPRVWQMCVYISVGANSQNFACTGTMVTGVKNFPASRGVVLGLLKGFVGLSGAVMAQIYLALYGDDSTSLILLIAWLPAAMSVLFAYTIRELDPTRSRQPRDEVRVFYHFLYISIALALFLMAINIAQKLLVFPPAAYAGSATVVCAILFFPLAIAIREELALWNTNSDQKAPPPPESDEIKSQKLALTAEPKTPPATATANWWAKTILEKPNRGEDYSILQALLSTDMLILLVASFCGLGSSLTAVDNLGQIGESLGYPAPTVSSCVSLVSIWNYLGRVFAGFASEALLTKYKFPRPLLMTVVLLISCAGHLLIAFPAPGSFYAASVITGFTFGAQFPLIFVIISDLFGLKHYSTLFNCGQMVSPLGSYVLSVMITGVLYDREARKQLDARGLSLAAGEELTCHGSQCYRLSFVVLSGVTLFGAAVSLVLVLRTLEFYRGDIYKKFRRRAEPDAAETDLSARLLAGSDPSR